MNKRLYGALLGVTVVSLVAASYFFIQYRSLKADPNKANAEETQKLVSRVGALILLPANEAPTVATVVDPEQLKDQPFFLNAKKGDKLLLYTSAKKAILYDPSAHKIIEVAPVNLGEGSGAPAGIAE